MFLGTPRSATTRWPDRSTGRFRRLRHLGPAVALTLVAALVTAVIGLADFRKHREAYTQGSAHAQWATALSVILLMVSGGTIYWNLRPLLGSVAEKVLRLAPCAVLAVRKPD